MYTGQVFCKSIFHTRPNPVHISLEFSNPSTERTFIKYMRTIRSISLSELATTVSNLSSRVKLLCDGLTVFRSLKYKVHTVPCKLKDQSSTILRSWSQQCECVAAQQLRRGQQMFCLYTKLWEERALKELLNLMRQHLMKRSREFVFGAVGLSLYDWDANRINDNEITKYMSDFDYVDLLKEKTMVCKNCNKRRLVDLALPDISYCKCSEGKSDYYSHENWTPFLERKDLVVWRRQQNSGHCEYKVYGTYDDVSAEDFLQVQIDTIYRRTWDTTAICLEVVDSDPNSNSDVIYWEMLWPRLFANRDYVFNRRYIIKQEEKVILLINRGTEHPACPVKPEKYRVQNYYSCMVIRPTSELNQPGIEFTLTYFDNPGVNIPSAVTSWVAMAGMPDFLCRLRQAAKNYQGYCNRKLRRDNGSDVSDAQPLIPQTLSSPAATDASPLETEINSSSTNSTWRYFHPQYYLG